MSSEGFRKVEDDFFVASQLGEPDFAAAARLGVRLIINNRPDGEAADQLSGDEAGALCAAAGLAYAHVPIVSGGLTRAALDAFNAAVDSAEGAVVAYCRSGTRSCYVWALSAARRLPPRSVLEAAHEAGYDVSSLGPALEAIHAAARR